MKIHLIGTLSTGILLVLALVTAFVIFNKKKKSSNDMHEIDVNSAVCSSRNVGDFVQLAMLRNAVDELTCAKKGCPQISKKACPGSNFDIGLYWFVFPTARIRKTMNDSKHGGNEELIYYRIFKNGNDNIRSLMERYSRLDGDNSSNFWNATDDVFDERSTSKKYIFTFVRNPIDRFISAYNEIEFRFQNRSLGLPLSSPIGSVDRIKEFIDYFIITARKSDHRFSGVPFSKSNRHYEFVHLAPAIGTLFYVHEKRGRFPNLYRLENFDNEWARLSIDSGFKHLSSPGVFSRGVQLMPHITSTDPLGTRKAAQQFFGNLLPQVPSRPAVHNAINAGTSRSGVFADQNPSETSSSSPPPPPSSSGQCHFEESSSTLEDVLSWSPSPSRSRSPVAPSSEPHADAELYLRVLCKTYLLDFMCAGYDFPPVCSNISAEVQELLREYHHAVAVDESRRPWMTRWMITLGASDAMLRGLAHGLCLAAASTAQCQADWIYGKENDDDETEENDEEAEYLGRKCDNRH